MQPLHMISLFAIFANAFAIYQSPKQSQRNRHLSSVEDPKNPPLLPNNDDRNLEIRDDWNNGDSSEKALREAVAASRVRRTCAGEGAYCSIVTQCCGALHCSRRKTYNGTCKTCLTSGDWCYKHAQCCSKNCTWKWTKFHKTCE